jgi:MFS family permease
MSQGLVGLYIGAFLGGLSIGWGTVAPVSVIMTNWFIKKRATYMSIVIAGSMFGGAVLMPASGLLIEHFDWRTAYRLLSLTLAIVTFITIIFFVTDDPKNKNQKAYGADEGGGFDKQGKATPQVGGLTLKEARSSASFWLLMLGILLVGCSTNIENYLPTFWRSEGMSVPTSSSIMGIYALITGVCTIILGRISDKLGGKTYITMTVVAFICGTALIYVVGAAATPVVILSVIPFAAGAKKTSTLTPPLVVAESFGRKHYGAIIGYFTGMLQLGIAISNPIIGKLHSYSGGFKVPFIAMMCLSAVALVLVLLALTTSPWRKSQQQQANLEKAS